MLAAKFMADMETGESRSKIQMEDLTLFKNCLMVRDRIWAPATLKRNFFNNLHLGHRGTDIMMRLAKCSLY